MNRRRGGEGGQGDGKNEEVRVTEEGEGAIEGACYSATCLTPSLLALWAPRLA